MKLARSATVLAVVLGSAVATGPAALAAGGGNVVRDAGRCATGTFELKAKHDNGRIDLEFEVDTNRVGQTWRVRITDNGTAVFTGARTTQAPSGSFTVRRMIPNRPGVDRIRATATRAGVTCTGVVRL